MELTGAVVAKWVSAAARLALAVTLLWSGGAKLGDLNASIRAVNAYHLLSADLARVVGAALPFVEDAIGLFLLVGLATRVAAAASGVLMAVFIGGIASAWARGLRIDCGCFGGGGELGVGEKPTYGLEIARDIALLLGAVVLLAWPRTVLAVDGWVARRGTVPEDLGDDLDEDLDGDDESDTEGSGHEHRVGA